MKASLHEADANGDQQLFFDCPGCGMWHGPTVRRANPDHKGPLWTWNGDLERPTLDPSIRVQGTVPLTPDEYERVCRGERIEPKPLTCHSFVRDGRIEFCGDSTHALAGQTVDLPEFDG